MIVPTLIFTFTIICMCAYTFLVGVSVGEARARRSTIKVLEEIERSLNE